MTSTASSVLANNFAMGTLLPLMCLLVSTGVIGAEIDDGSIVYMLAKPLKRRVILFSKLVVALAAVLVFAVLPTMLTVMVAGDQDGRLTLAYGASAAVGRYRVHRDLCHLEHRHPQRRRLRLAVCTAVGDRAGWLCSRHPRGQRAAVGAVGGGANARFRCRSTWAVTSEVGLVTGIMMLTVVTVAALYLGVRKLQTLTLSSVE